MAASGWTVTAYVPPTQFDEQLTAATPSASVIAKDVDGVQDAPELGAGYGRADRSVERREIRTISHGANAMARSVGEKQIAVIIDREKPWLGVLDESHKIGFMTSF